MILPRLTSFLCLVNFGPRKVVLEKRGMTDTLAREEAVPTAVLLVCVFTLS